MSRYSQQLKRTLASRAPEESRTTPRRKVTAGQPFDAFPGEQLDVVADVDGAEVIVGRVTATTKGRFTVG